MIKIAINDNGSISGGFEGVGMDILTQLPLVMLKLGDMAKNVMDSIEVPEGFREDQFEILKTAFDITFNGGSKEDFFEFMVNRLIEKHKERAARDAKEDAYAED